MRGLLIEPGPWYSVMDVARGWTKGLTECGVDMRSVNLGDRVGFFTGAHMETYEGKFVRAFDVEQGLQLAATESVESACYRWWPDIVVIISGFYIPAHVYEEMRMRGHKIVLIHTESPYEDDIQTVRAPYADLNIVNDPTNLDNFPTGSVYLPHAYDPDVHHPAPVSPERASEFFFCGTGYPSRIEFLEQVDWTGIDLKLAGNWKHLPEASPLAAHLVHERAVCMDNTDTVRWYQSTKTSANLYRREGPLGAHVDGWSMGPREVELAACGTWFARDPRGESDDLLPMLPTFTDPGELGDLIRWALAHPTERADAALKAREAVAPRTFAHNAAELLGLLGL